jgi:hypothetical protein
MVDEDTPRNDLFSGTLVVEVENPKASARGITQDSRLVSEAGRSRNDTGRVRGGLLQGVLRIDKATEGLPKGGRRS